jgi:hypothetical protein
MEEKDKLDYLLKKWELLWNHYKLQNEMFDKRNGFLWIIQGAMFVGLSHSIGKANLIAIIMPFVGLLVSFGWVIIAKRHIESIFLTEKALRDVESQWNTISNHNNYQICLDKFILDNRCIWDGEPHEFQYSSEVYNETEINKLWEINAWPINNIDNYFNNYLNKYPKIRSISICLGSIIPKLFLMIWVILFIITLVLIIDGATSIINVLIIKNG